MWLLFAFGSAVFALGGSQNLEESPVHLAAGICEFAFAAVLAILAVVLWLKGSRVD